MREIFEGFNEMNEKISKGFKALQDEMFAGKLSDKKIEDLKGLKDGIELVLLAHALQKLEEQEEKTKVKGPSPCACGEKKLNEEKARLEKEEIDRLKETKRLREENTELKRQVRALQEELKAIHEHECFKEAQRIQMSAFWPLHSPFFK